MTRITAYVSTEADLRDYLLSDYTIELQNNITLAAAGSTSSTFTISAKTNLVINGNGYTLRAQSGRIFYIQSSSAVEMNDLTLENGWIGGSHARGGAIYLIGSSTLEMRACTLSGSVASRTWYSEDTYGGAIYASSSILIMMTCVLSGNNVRSHGDAFGGAIYSSSSTVTLESCVLSGNIAYGYNPNNPSSGSGHPRGGAIYSTSSRFIMTACTLAENSAVSTIADRGLGGAIYIHAYSMACTGCTFVASNTATTAGNDVYISNGANFSTADCATGGGPNGEIAASCGGDACGTTYFSYCGGTVPPTALPTIEPTASPTGAPTFEPSLRPTFEPTASPT
jgi:hypothetical protein